MKTAVGVYPSCIFTLWHRCALFIRMERVHPVPYTKYIPIGVGFYCFLSLTLRFLPTYLKSEDIDSNMIPAPFLCK